MLSEKLIRYPPYNLHTTEIPKCSTLYCLEPIGIGTPSCESLTSYLIRLADVHCVSLDKLIKHKIYPIFWSHNDLCTYSKGIVGRTFTHHSHLKSLNFSGWYASKLVESLEILTLRGDLTFLTMMPWQELINHIYLLRSHKAWCPLCYDYWRKNRVAIYEPLLWSLEPVAMCLHHHYPLVTQCPSCNQRLSIISANSRPGDCNHCGEWLGNLEKSKFSSQTLSQDEIKLQSELIKIFGSLIASTPEASSHLQKRFYRQVITYFQIKELENIELSNHQISCQRIHKSMTYTGHTVQDFWQVFSPTALEAASKY